MMVKIGDYVKVKKGTKDPDFEDLLIEEWEGYVVKIIEEYEDENIALICIEWDKDTLDKFPKKYIKKCEIERYDWRLMNLYVTDVEIVID
jgi:hypothetical protein